MRRSLLPLLAALLVGCGAAPPPPTSPTLEPRWTATVRGVPIIWEIVRPGSLGRLWGDPNGPVVGARAYMGERPCRIQIDTVETRADMPGFAAHEVGHCLQAFHGLPGIPRPELGGYWADPTEGFAETFAEAYRAACGPSLAPLGWSDTRPARCAEVPDPRGLRRP